MIEQLTGDHSKQLDMEVNYLFHRPVFNVASEKRYLCKLLQKMLNQMMTFMIHTTELMVS